MTTIYTQTNNTVCPGAPNPNRKRKHDEFFNVEDVARKLKYGSTAKEWKKRTDMETQREKERLAREKMEKDAKKNPLFYSEESFMEWLESLAYSHVDTQE